MLAKYKINIFTISSASTATTINIPINLEYQLVDNSDLVERQFVDLETQKAVNPILDYDKVRFIPVDNNSRHVSNVTYMLSFLNSQNTLSIPTYYSNISIDDSDIKFGRNTFKESFLHLEFFDSDNPLTQTLISEIEIYSMLTVGDYYSSGVTKPLIAGQPKPASQIPVRFILSNPLIVKKGFYEGYHIYNYKDNVVIGTPLALYMKASYFNAKTGKLINLMTENVPLRINDLVNKLYTKYNLFRDSTGFYYSLDNQYSNNVSYSDSILTPNNPNVLINLYQIQAI